METPARMAPESAARGNRTKPADHTVRNVKLAAAGGAVGALGVASCCLLPMELFSLGASGAWVTYLSALTPYRPIFVLFTTALLGYGHYSVYWNQRKLVSRTGRAPDLVRTDW